MVDFVFLHLKGRALVKFRFFQSFGFLQGFLFVRK